jgi:hypothetical protein
MRWYGGFARIFVFFVWVANIGDAMSAGYSDFLFPPPSPQAGEQQLDDDPDFRRECLDAAGFLVDEGVVVHASRISLNDHWGVILRIDFEIPALSMNGSTDRLVCWKHPSGEIRTLVTTDEAPMPR